MPRISLTTTLALAILGAAGCANDDTTTAQATAQDGGSTSMGVLGSNREDGDRIVTLEECPDAVQQCIQAYLGGGTIKEIERTTDHGEVLFEVDVHGANGMVEFDVAEDGAFRGHDGDGEDDEMNGDDEDFDNDADDDGDGEDEEIPLSEVPEHVRAAALAAVPGIVLEEAEREVEDGVAVYCLEGEADGRDYEIDVNADGVVLETEVDDEGPDEADDGDDDGDDD